MDKSFEQTTITTQLNQDVKTQIGSTHAATNQTPASANGRFETKGLLGSGGLSEVSLLYDHALHRYTALKYLKSEYLDHPEALLRFQYEAQLMAQLEHPNIIPVHEFYIEPTGQSINMKRVEGESLTHYIQELGETRLDHLDKILEILLKVLDAVGFVHNRGVIHRDLKPSNIMICRHGEVYLVDWGIAKPFRACNEEQDIQLRAEALAALQQYEHGAIGTPAYMSPEQTNGLTDALDPRSDIFSLGATLYFCLTGHTPYPMQDKRAQYDHLREIPAAHYIPEGILNITQRAMALRPEDRYQSIADMHRDIEDFLHGKHLPILHYPAGATITRAGECRQTAYFIQEGRCVAYAEGDTASGPSAETLGPGDIFGVLCILSERQRAKTIQALTDTIVLEISPQSLSQDLGLNDWFGVLFKQLVQRFLNLESQLPDQKDSV